MRLCRGKHLAHRPIFQLTNDSWLDGKEDFLRGFRE